MAKTKFNEMKEDTGGGDEDSALIQVEPGQGEIQISNDQLAADGLVGDWSREDLNYPRINIAAKTGKLLDEGFELGSVVLSRQCTLAVKEEPVKLIVVACVKQYQEDVPWGAEETPKVFDSVQQMREAGYSTEYGAVNYCQPMAHFTFLIPSGSVKEDSDDLFPFEFDDQKWAMAQFTASKTGFKTTAKPLASHLAFGGNDRKIYDRWWELSSRLKSYGENTWYSPYLKKGEKVSPEVMEFVESIL